MSRVVNQNVDGDSGLRESFRHDKTQSTVDSACTIRCRLQCINLLKRLYTDQKATVLTDKESDVFEIKRGTKQGEPLSSLLFNTVLQAALEDDLALWREEGVGHQSG